MVPITPEQLREHVCGWPVIDLRQPIRAALPNLDVGMDALIAHWLLSDVTDLRPPLGADQIAAIWQAVQGRAQ
jgi:hypothetical protein